MRIYIPTRGRADKQNTLQNLPAELLKQAVLVIDKDEQDQHKKFADQIELLVTPPEYAGGIGIKRQFIVDQHDVKEYGPKIVMIDDDLTFMKRRTDDPEKFEGIQTKEVTKIFHKLETLLDQYAQVCTRGRQGANNETRPLVEIGRAMSVLAFDVNVLRKHNIHFSRLKVMEDFDVTLQLLRLGYKNAIVGDYIHSGSPSNSAGGCSIERTMKVQKEAAEKLAELHAPFVKTVLKKTKTAWGGEERTDVIVQWKKAYESSEVPSDPGAKPETLSTQQLKTALRAACKKYETSAKKEMSPLVYWLREKMRAQGSRNDIHDRDRGFGAWVDEHLDISRRTADRWANEWGIAKGLMKPTFSHVSKSEDDDFQAAEVAKHNNLVQVKYLKYWVPPHQQVQFTQAVKILQKHFKAANDKEAIFKGVLYVANTIARGAHSGKAQRPTAGKTSRNHPAGQGQNRVARSGVGRLQQRHGVNGHRGRKGPVSDTATVGRKAFRASAG